MTAIEEGMLDPLGEAESRALLMTAEIGRLAFTDGHGPTVQPFAFALQDTSIVVGVGLLADVRSAIGQTVAFEVDEIDLVHRTGWSVVAVGTLHRAPATTLARADRWPDLPSETGRALRLVIDVRRITGRRLRRVVTRRPRDGSRR
ncbi:hypothetical protein GCM10023200_16110 [Actinomycetospora chlora]|uniref:Pyridoxamine 5'-phosphate oxidase family protein n=1 Tax=Actinomycetospora chlora TaxID=663608 RepID=A0ABP9AMY6_9PSEU